MGNFQIDLHECKNTGCQSCKPETRRKGTENHLCRITIGENDGQPVRCVGDWAYEKIYRLVQYFGIFSNGMKNKWGGRLNYIEICSGPGRCIFRDEGLEVDGTPLAIINSPAFQHIHSARFIDFNEEVVATLNKRISDIGQEGTAKAVFGDFNSPESLTDALAGISPGHLNLVFIDPTECDVPLQSLLYISEILKNVDFIINVAYGTDANRNLVNAVADPSFSRVKEKYINFLGSSEFFEDIENIKRAEINDNKALIDSFRDYYQSKLREYKFEYFDEKRVKHYYSLMFASRSSKGLEFWEKANRIEPDGQRTFDFY